LAAVRIKNEGKAMRICNCKDPIIVEKTFEFPAFYKAKLVDNSDYGVRVTCGECGEFIMWKKGETPFVQEASALR
jgi:hypothetical protein